MATGAVQVQPWWTPALRGLLAILFGLVLLIWPSLALATLQVLIVLFGTYALIDGILAVVATVGGIQQHDQWWPHLLEGILGITAAALVFIWTDITVVVLLWVIAAWAAFNGVFKIIPAVQRGEWLLGTSGLASIVFGFVLATYASAGIETALLVIGIYAVIMGILLVAQGFQLATQPQR